MATGWRTPASGPTADCARRSDRESAPSADGVCSGLVLSAAHRAPTSSSARYRAAGRTCSSWMALRASASTSSSSTSGARCSEVVIRRSAAGGGTSPESSLLLTEPTSTASGSAGSLFDGARAAPGAAERTRFERSSPTRATPFWPTSWTRDETYCSPLRPATPRRPGCPAPPSGSPGCASPESDRSTPSDDLASAVLLITAADTVFRFPRRSALRRAGEPKDIWLVREPGTAGALLDSEVYSSGSSLLRASLPSE